ncbi:hypothetical protein SLEP1_g2709 [Rubroshorea leprosula]|uniref:Uncharacterized protein n=1 Tax=Rubroshorea leprosula TaxID=152421 RepID=A0AAV5HQB7_9ROSI|nr:hypothetical protein SLEP1_g2709 [Rubroshorea leprosula]
MHTLENLRMSSPRGEDKEEYFFCGGREGIKHGIFPVWA